MRKEEASRGLKRRSKEANECIFCVICHKSCIIFHFYVSLVCIENKRFFFLIIIISIAKYYIFIIPKKSHNKNDLKYLQLVRFFSTSSWTLNFSLFQFYCFRSQTHTHTLKSFIYRVSRLCV